MNFFNYMEYVQQHHPDVRDKELRYLLNRCSDDFCRRTEIYRPVIHIATVAGQRYYEFTADLIKIISVQINDVEIPRLLGDPIIDDDEFGEATGTEDTALSTPGTPSDERYWYMKSGKLGIVEKATNAVTRDGKTSDYQSMSETGKEIRVYAISTPTHLSASDSYTSSSVGLFGNIPSVFHDALVFYSISNLYEDSRNLNIDLANRFYSKYLELVNEAKKYARNNKTLTGFIKPVDF